MTNNISTKFQNCLHFRDVQLLLDQAKVKISYWGDREITVTGFEGSVSLDSVVWKVDEIGRRNKYHGIQNQKGSHQQIHSIDTSHVLDFQEYSQTENSRLDLCWKIFSLYQSSDTELKTKGIFTRASSFLREILTYSFSGKAFFENNREKLGTLSAGKQTLKTRADSFFRRNFFGYGSVKIRNSHRESPDYEVTMNSLFEKYQGICFGESHKDNFPNEFFFEHMEFFQKQGVNTLFIELMYEEIQKDLDLFNAEGTVSDRMKQRLGLDTEKSRRPLFSTLDVLQEARKRGIRIVGIDSIKVGGLGQEGYRIEEMNYGAGQIIEREKLKGKYITWMGSAHLNSNSVEISFTIPCEFELRAILSALDSSYERKDWKGIISCAIQIMGRKLFEDESYDFKEFSRYRSRESMNDFYMAHRVLIDQLVEKVLPKVGISHASKVFPGICELTQCPSVILTSHDEYYNMQKYFAKDYEQLHDNGCFVLRLNKHTSPNFNFFNNRRVQLAYG